MELEEIRERKAIIKKSFEEMNPDELDIVINAIDKAFVKIQTWSLDIIDNADNFIDNYKKQYPEKKDKIDLRVYTYLRALIRSALGPMAYGQEMLRYFHDKPSDYKASINVLLGLARMLKNNSDYIKPIIKNLAKIDKKLQPRLNDNRTTDLIKELIDLQVNAILVLISRKQVASTTTTTIKKDDEFMHSFISDVKDKIKNVNDLLKTKSLQAVAPPITTLETNPQLLFERKEKRTEEKKGTDLPIMQQTSIVSEKNKMYGGSIDNHNRMKYMKYKAKYMKLKSKLH